MVQLTLVVQKIILFFPNCYRLCAVQKNYDRSYVQIYFFQFTQICATKNLENTPAQVLS